MGTQIIIEIEDLEEAGWEVGIETLPAIVGGEGVQSFPETHHLVIRKGEWEFCSYSPKCFYADCNAWGQNRQLFKEAGLFELKYQLV